MFNNCLGGFFKNLLGLYIILSYFMMLYEVIVDDDIVK